MNSSPKRLSVIGLLLVIAGSGLLAAHFLRPGWPLPLSTVGAFLFVIGLVVLGVTEEQWRTREGKSRDPLSRPVPTARNARR